MAARSAALFSIPTTRCRHPPRLARLSAPVVSSDSVKCYNGEYHSFERGAYAPPSPPPGYEAVYYHSRPDTTYYSRVEYSTTTTYNDGNGGYSQQDTRYSGYAPSDSQPAYSAPQSYAPPPPSYSQTTTTQSYGDDSHSNGGDQGFRDEQGHWHRGEPRAIGWQDDAGNGTAAASPPMAGATARAAGTKTIPRTIRTPKARATATETKRAGRTGPPFPFKLATARSVHGAARLVLLARTARAGVVTPDLGPLAFRRCRL